MIDIGIVGGTGYTGAELLRILSGHPQARIRTVTSRSQAGVALDSIFPHLRGSVQLVYATPENSPLEECDLVFFAAPNGTAMEMAPGLLSSGVKIIDLAADFRLKSTLDWEKWYGCPHACPQILDEAVYGLPELNRERIAAARVVGNPGCYPTAIILGLLPLLEAGAVSSTNIIADAKSGVSGAGRSPSERNLYCENSENFHAYAVSGHRHTPEIEQALSTIAGTPTEVVFVPHLVPMIRGIHASLYASLIESSTDVLGVFRRRYENEAFVDVMSTPSHPDTRSVRGSNMCRISVHRSRSEQQIIVLSVIDNLVKGAAGQAVQNMNLMFGLPETCGLEGLPVAP